MNLQIGMTQEQVEQTLHLLPYDLKEYTDTSNVFTYIYRVRDRQTLAHFTKPRNGRKSLGKYVQLFVTYSKDSSKVTHIESCSTCPDNLVHSSRVNMNIGKALTFMTVTLPVILVYIGLKSQ